MIHIRTHASDTPYECMDCFKKFRQVNYHCFFYYRAAFFVPEFTTQKAKVDHEHIHKGGKPYCCTFCKSQFSTYSEHFCHEALHKMTNKPELQCTVCLKTFISAKSIYQHSHGELKENFVQHMWKVICKKISARSSCKDTFRCEVF
nr:unnamed protein product [Callosobruchus analis]